MSPASTTGSVALGSATASTAGVWLPPSGYDCVNLLLNYSGLVDQQMFTYYAIDLLTSTGDIIGSASVAPYQGAPASGTTAMGICGNEASPIDATKPVSLRITDELGASATGTPFAWATTPITPPRPKALPASASLRGISVQTYGNWLKPKTVPAISTFPTYAYLISFTDLAPEGSFYAAFVDPATRTQLMAGQATNLFPSTTTLAGLTTAVYSATANSAPASFMLQLGTQAGDLVEVGPYTWSAQAPPLPAPVATPQPVTLDSLVVTPTGDWRVPALCGKVNVSYTARPNDWMRLSVRLLNADTREILGVRQVFDYSESATLDFSVCSRVTSQTRLILQVEAPPGIAESVPFRWEGTSVAPEKVTSLQASVPKQKGRVTLRWQPPPNASEAGVTGYQYRVNAGAWQSVSKPSITLTRLPRKKPVTFSVRAVAGDVLGAEARVTATPR